MRAARIARSAAAADAGTALHGIALIRYARARSHMPINGVEVSGLVVKGDMIAKAIAIGAAGIAIAKTIGAPLHPAFRGGKDGASRVQARQTSF